MSNRTIKNLAEKKGRVYVYLADRKIGEQFMKQAESEGFTFSDGVKLSQPDRGYATIMAINHDNTINYVGANGRIAFGGGFKKVGDEKLIRVDYQKYSDGDKNYIYGD